MVEVLLLALLLSAPGAPPGLGLAIGTWPTEAPGRGAPKPIRDWAEPHIERQLPPEERGCFLYAFEDLDGDGRDEFLVYVKTFGQCGTAGCPLYVMKWHRARLGVVSRTDLIHNVFLAPWPRHGWRPLYLEKWGELIFRVPARGGRYPEEVPLIEARALGEVPEGTREAAWIEARCCASQAPYLEAFGPR